MSRTLLSLAGFQVIISGRFWVIAEAFLPCRVYNCETHYLITQKWPNMPTEQVGPFLRLHAPALTF
jgi:hypothetical protein